MMAVTKRYASILATLLVCLAATSCAPTVPAGRTPAAWIQDSLDNLPQTSNQVLLVTADKMSSFKAHLYALERDGDGWRNAFAPLPALIGSQGIAPPGEKREGDRRTPSGVFSLQRTFGYAPAIDSRMPYRQAGNEDIWVDDPASSDYNRWVSKSETSADSYEVLKRSDDCYKYGIVVEYNTEPVVKGAGSAIFIHVRGSRNQPTLGCVALSERDLLKVLRWLDPAAQPLAVLGTKDSLSLVTKGAGALLGEDGGRS